MTMPLQFDKPAYLKILLDAGIAPSLAEAHAEAIETGLDQPIVLPADLAVIKADILSRLDQRLVEFKQEIVVLVDQRLVEFKQEIVVLVDQRLVEFKSKLKPVYLMSAISLVLSVASVLLNYLILARLDRLL